MATALTERATGVFSPQGILERVRQAHLPWMPCAIMSAVAVCAVFAPWIAPYDPTEINMLDRKLPPAQDWSYPLGTDRMGRDMLSRLIYGARTSAFISLVVLSAGAFVGTVLGLISGYVGRWIDVFIMRLTDAAMGLPFWQP